MKIAPLIIGLLLIGAVGIAALSRGGSARSSDPAAEARAADAGSHLDAGPARDGREAAPAGSGAAGEARVRAADTADPATIPDPGGAEHRVAADQAGRSPRVIAGAGGSAGDTYAVDVENGLSVFGRGADLIVADVSNPAEPVQIGALTVSAPVRDVVLFEDYAYVAADSTGFHIVDLSDPDFPRASSSLRFDDRVYGVDTNGRHAFVAARSSGFHVVDVSDPEKPVRVGHMQTPDDAVDVVVRGDYAYVAAWYESMRVIDISDPTHPQEVSFASYDSYDNGTAWSVYVEGDIGLATVPDMGLRTVDISNPRDVKLYKVYRGLLAPIGVAARGLTAFVADQDAGLRVLRLDDPVRPVEIGRLDVPGRAVGVTLFGDHAYVAAREGGLRVLDVSSPHDPREVGRLDPSDEMVDVAVSGRTVVAAGAENGVHVYRYAEGLSPVAVYPMHARRVRIRDDRIYVASEEGIHLLRDTDEASIVPDLPAPPEGFDVSAGHIVVAGGASGLQIFRLDADGVARAAGEYHAERQPDPARADMQLLRGPVAAWDVILSGDVAYGAFDDGIRTVDLTAPSAPLLLDHLQIPQRTYRLELVGSRLYAACDDGIRIIDASNPAALRELSFYKTPSFATSILVDGSRLYAGDLTGTVSVLDAAEPDLLLAEWNLGGRLYGLAHLGDELAIAAGRGGVQVVTVPPIP